MHLNDQIKEVLDVHNGLIFNSIKNTLEGELFLLDGDSYEVLIDLNSYPRIFPTVYETGGRIPVKMDRHVYPDSGSCCFTTRAKSQVLLKTVVKSLLDFIDEILIRYLENNSYYELNNHYYSEEYSHGKLGIIEAYKDILQIDDPIKVAKTLIKAVKSKKMVIHQNCYCDSGRRLRKCLKGKHLSNLRKLYMVDKDILKQDLNSFNDAINVYLDEQKLKKEVQ
ncbi:hypothetical protein [uncultured Polaribacter sp.]|uniref:hypothetical protein n=1 Tax=uncultured Polaribacter sp. TaxID=174711 RepID=UPI00259B3ED6|nr:hypothetical protein [uncultured Polaribacter sp.]